MKVGIGAAWLTMSIIALVITLHSQRAALRDAQILEQRVSQLLSASHQDQAEVFGPPDSGAIVVRIHNRFGGPALASSASACLALATILRLVTRRRNGANTILEPSSNRADAL